MAQIAATIERVNSKTPNKIKVEDKLITFKSKEPVKIVSEEEKKKNLKKVKTFFNMLLFPKKKRK